MINDKKVLFSGMQATGNLTLGNYLGALKNWLTLSDEYECFYSVVDLHSITVRQNPAELRKSARNLLTLYIAAGLNPRKTAFFPYFFLISRIDFCNLRSFSCSFFNAS